MNGESIGIGPAASSVPDTNEKYAKNANWTIKKRKIWNSRLVFLYSKIILIFNQ